MSALLQETLDALDDGLVRFDGALTLVAWNRRLVELLGFPPALMRAGTPFLAFVDFNIDRGEHGPGPRRLIVRQRLESVADSYERRRPDGTLMRVRGRQMPDGGFLKLFTALAGPGATGGAAPSGLSAREREVLLWVARGKTAWETAAILGISPKTVDFHLTRCREKLGVASKAQLVATAVQRGLVPL